MSFRRAWRWSSISLQVQPSHSEYSSQRALMHVAYQWYWQFCWLISLGRQNILWCWSYAARIWPPADRIGGLGGCRRLVLLVRRCPVRSLHNQFWPQIHHHWSLGIDARISPLLGVGAGRFWFLPWCWPMANSFLGCWCCPLLLGVYLWNINNGLSVCHIGMFACLLIASIDEDISTTAKQRAHWIRWKGRNEFMGYHCQLILRVFGQVGRWSIKVLYVTA